LGSVTIFKRGRAFDIRLARAKRFNDLLREDSEASCPTVLAHARSEFTAIYFNFFPGAIANL
jgi:hypothetical protein